MFHNKHSIIITIAKREYVLLNIGTQLRSTHHTQAHIHISHGPSAAAVVTPPSPLPQVIMLFIRYLAKRKPSLIDPTNKSRVLCADDPLGRVFGVNCFTKEQTRYVCGGTRWRR